MVMVTNLGEAKVGLHSQRRIDALASLHTSVAG